MLWKRLRVPSIQPKEIFFHSLTISHRQLMETQQHKVSRNLTDSSPCSCCSKEDKIVETPNPKPKKNEFAQSKGFNLAVFEGEEDSPMKLLMDACK